MMVGVILVHRRQELTLSMRPPHQLATVPLFATLAPATLDALATESRVRHYAKGQVLCSEGDPGTELLVLEAGHVRISRFTAGGQEIVLATAEAPTAFGELALIDGAPRSATLIAVSDVTVRFLARQAVLALIEHEPATAMAMLRSLTAMIRATNERLADVLSLDVPGRVAKWLLRQAAIHGEPRPHGIAVPLHQSQGELATELGVTRVSVNKALKGFEALGLLTVAPGEIVIADADALARYTE